MYEQKFPEVDDVVMVQVKSIAEMGAYVALLEYNGIEGMILLSELSRRRIRSISKLIKVGRQEPVMVLRVDKEKGYIDLSKRRVAPEDVAACEEKYNKSKMVHSILRHVAETTGADVEQLYADVGWPLYKKYGHCFDAFKVMVQDTERILNELAKVDADGNTVPAMEPHVSEALIKNIKRRMTPQPLKIRADVELTCFQYDGVIHIKDAMRAAEKCSTEECQVKVMLVASPLYTLTTHTLDKEIGVVVLNEATEALKAAIESKGGKIVVKESARAVSEREDRLLAESMEKLAKASEEVDGDMDSEEEEEGMGNVNVDKVAGLVE